MLSVTGSTHELNIEQPTSAAWQMPARPDHQRNSLLLSLDSLGRRPDPPGLPARRLPLRFGIIFDVAEIVQVATCNCPDFVFGSDVSTPEVAATFRQ